MSDELKPCPFCGSDATLRNVEMVGCAYASCTNCGAMGEDASIDRAISKWNTRADTDALTAAQEENERLVHDIERLSASLSAEVTGSEKLRKAIEALGVMPEGYCFCSRHRIGDDSKIHEPECADLRSALNETPNRRNDND